METALGLKVAHELPLLLPGPQWGQAGPSGRVLQGDQVFLQGDQVCSLCLLDCALALRVGRTQAMCTR